MARKLMAKYECSRCTREWYEEFKRGEEPPEPPSFKMSFRVPGEPDVAVGFEELCKSCTKTVKNYAGSIAKQLTHKSPKRAKKEKASNDAPSISVEATPEPAPPSPSPSEGRRTSSAGKRAS